MLYNLKMRIRRWLGEFLQSLVIEDSSSDLEVRLPGRGVVRVRALRCCGMMLVVEDDRLERRVVTVEHAMLEDRYWVLWKRLGGSSLQWSDGTPFDPQASSTM